MNSRIKAQDYHYDAIVIGSGISGGMAAKELCEKGLKTLLLDRGRDVRHVIDYPTANLQPWDFRFRTRITREDWMADPVQSAGYDAATKHFYIRDEDNPYIQKQPFSWFQGNQVGGRSLLWGRQCYRLSDLDFEANIMDGAGIDWPIRYKDIAPWYDYVEQYIGVSGQNEGLDHLPDGVFLPPMELNCVEQHLREHIQTSFGRTLTIARVANLTRGWKGRGPCLYRNLCSRGCPVGGYFSSNSATIPQAMATGNLTLRPFSLVNEVIYDDREGLATGVRIIDTETMDSCEFYAKIIFINASTIATAAILLRSRSNRFPNGLGNDSGQVGLNLMDHHSSAGASGIFPGFREKYYSGRRPCGFLIPRFRNVGNDKQTGFVRGYQLQGMGKRLGWSDQKDTLAGFGKTFKKSVLSPGPWTVWLGGWGECLPSESNRIYVDFSIKDKWGLPMTTIDFAFGKNEESMQADIQDSCAEMLETAGFKQINTFNHSKPGGGTVHEMGTARMGRDPNTSVLNAFNQLHAVKNVFITDGSCMTSSACQNPSLTYMALTARACAYAVDQLKKGELK